MTNLLKIQIPFSGFYGSSHDALFDTELENELENFAQEYDASNEILCEYSDQYFSAVDWRKAQAAYAVEYAEAFADKVEEETGLKMPLVFDEMTSPREYNFETDKIFAFINAEAVQEMRERVSNKNLQALISERHTSRDGFISFYDNSLADWPENVLEWDEIQLDTLLQAFLFQEMGEDWDDDFKGWVLMEDACGNGRMQDFIWSSMPEDKCELMNALEDAIREEDEAAFYAAIKRNKEKQIPLKGEVATLTGGAANG